MNYRRLGKTSYQVSEIGIGTWQLGAKWGERFDHSKAVDILQEAYQGGVNLIDTADIYQDGLSEKTVGEFLKTVKDKVYVVTKVGRKTNPHTASNYNRVNLTKYVDACLDNLQVSSLDLVLLHCPPGEIYKDPAVYETLDLLKQQGKIAHYGVSVETVEEAINASQFDISAVEIIFNMFRLKPRELFFDQAAEKDLGILARVPLASGLLTGKFDNQTVFGENDHRKFNRNGEAFDQGETFSGVDYENGILAMEALKAILGDENLAQKALKFILMHKEVSAVIPGASNAAQVTSNLSTLSMPDLRKEELDAVTNVYNSYLRKNIEQKW
ncbi:aldo/keto reductase [Pedobacter hartonius]|uniref:Predicted oxidoreductase n=1 Tax=Pedobacter hartonius TaxID=425514 RepID=A0A1H4HK82_9SPHI|nr:aldo/keto reductase [Pedobacter hartonius]SEB21492.1 Predicted oxidoreductase [Pedobacter hartonius]